MTISIAEMNVIRNIAEKFEIPLSIVGREILRMTDQKEWEEAGRRGHVKKLMAEKARQNAMPVNAALQERVFELEKQLGELLKELRG